MFNTLSSLYSRSYKNPLYNTWKDMRKRCTNPNRRDYQWYGAKGITVCDRWQDFKLFCDDMASSWEHGMTLNRLDNTKGYYKDNCNWKTLTEQQGQRDNVKQLWLLRAEMQRLAALGFTQEEIAVQLNCSQGSISRILNGLTNQDCK